MILIEILSRRGFYPPPEIFDIFFRHSIVSPFIQGIHDHKNRIKISVNAERGKDAITAVRVASVGDARADTAEIVAVVEVRAAEPPPLVG